MIRLLDQKSDSNFLQNISKEISVNISEVSTNVSDIISNFNLIGNIDKGRFRKIVSKGEFEKGKYLDISLKVDKISKKKSTRNLSRFTQTIIIKLQIF